MVCVLHLFDGLSQRWCLEKIMDIAIWLAGLFVGGIVMMLLCYLFMLACDRI